MNIQTIIKKVTLNSIKNKTPKKEWVDNEI